MCTSLNSDILVKIGEFISNSSPRSIMLFLFEQLGLCDSNVFKPIDNFDIHKYDFICAPQQKNKKLLSNNKYLICISCGNGDSELICKNCNKVRYCSFKCLNLHECHHKKYCSNDTFMKTKSELINCIKSFGTIKLPKLTIPGFHYVNSIGIYSCPTINTEMGFFKLPKEYMGWAQLKVIEASKGNNHLPLKIKFGDGLNDIFEMVV
jgi:hypothetical protein